MSIKGLLQIIPKITVFILLSIVTAISFFENNRLVFILSATTLLMFVDLLNDHLKLFTALLKLEIIVLKREVNRILKEET